MSTEKNIYFGEFIIFVGTVLLLAGPGLLYMIITPLGDLWFNLSQEKLAQIIIIEILNVATALSLFAICYASYRFINFGQLISPTKTPIVFALLIIGIFISTLAGLELAIPDHMIKPMLGLKDNTAFFVIYIPGLSVCVPTLHLLTMSYISANKRMQSVVAEPRH